MVIERISRSRLVSIGLSSGEIREAMREGADRAIAGVEKPLAASLRSKAEAVTTVATA